VMTSVVDLLAEASRLNDTWFPRVVGRVNDHLVKVAKLQGQLVWHDHARQDEMFLVLAGELRIELEGQAPIRLTSGQMFVVPRGLRHNPVAEQECLIALFEPADTAHTGDIADSRSRTLAEQMRAE